MTIRRLIPLLVTMFILALIAFAGASLLTSPFSASVKAPIVGTKGDVKSTIKLERQLSEQVIPDI